MSEPPRRKVHSCDSCRQRKIQCDRTLPSCKGCAERGVVCSYPGTESRYSISREKSCIRCRRRRTRCDRSNPCNACRKGGFECIYTSFEREQSELPTDILLRDLESGNDAQCRSEDAPRPQQLSQAVYPLCLLGHRPPPLDLRELHPPLIQIWTLWHLFVENVDPLLKIFHAPSFNRQILHVVQDLDSMDAGAETLLFSVFHAAIISITDEECLQVLKEPRVELLERYRYGLEQCLVRSNFLTNPTLTSLQALVLYLITARYSPLTAPIDSLLALAIRLAMRLGLHMDRLETLPQSSPIITLAEKTETEMQLRLWWHIMTIDVRLAEDAGTDPTIWDGMWNAEMPGNFDDVELDTFSQLPLPPDAGETFDPDTVRIQRPNAGGEHRTYRDRRTDMSFALLRIEMTHAMRRLAFSEQFCRANGYEYLSTTAARVQFLESMMRDIDLKYLQFCNRNDMFSFFERNAAKLILSRHLMMASKDGPIRETLHNCVQVLEAAAAMRKIHKKWSWLLRSYVEFDALALLWECLGKILKAAEQDVSVNSRDGGDEELRHAWTLAEVAFQRRKEDDLKYCYGDKGLRIEKLRGRALELRRAE